MSQIPTTQQCLLQAKDGTLVSGKKSCHFTGRPGTVLVQVKAVALNPTDWKLPRYFPAPGASSGCDFSGTVVAVSPDLEEAVDSADAPKVGQRVCGAVYGSDPLNKDQGAFSEYITTDGDMLLNVPESLSWEEAAAIGGIGHGTVNLAMWQVLKLDGWPGREGKTNANGSSNLSSVLVYGGNTATGSMAIQLLQEFGYTPLVVASSSSLPLLRSRYGLSEDDLFSYQSATCGGEIKERAKNKLRYALDCISDGPSAEICYAALGRLGGRYACLEISPDAAAVKSSRKLVKSGFVMGFEMFGSKVALGDEPLESSEPAEIYYRVENGEARTRAASWVQVMQGLLNNDRVKCHPVRVIPGGLEGIPHGLEKLKTGSTRGEKLVCRVNG